MTDMTFQKNILNGMRQYPWASICLGLGTLCGGLIAVRQQQYRNDSKLVNFTNIVGGCVTYGSLSALGGFAFGPIGFLCTASGAYSQFIYLDPLKKKWTNIYILNTKK